MGGGGVAVDEGKLAEVLSDFARTLITDFPIQRILEHLAARIVEVLPVTAAGVSLISVSRGPHHVAASDDAALRFEQLQVDLDEGPCVLAYQTGEAVAVPDIRVDDRFPRFSPAAVSAGLVAVFTLPLRHGDGQIGALDLYRDVPGEMDAHAMSVAQTLADVASAYLLNAHAREEAREASDRFEHRALHDPLTGLPNRMLLQERLEHAAVRAQRTETRAAVFFIDLDRFKHVNDTYGHSVGDELLTAVASRLATLSRAGDTLARLSGDEFVLLCEDMVDTADAEMLAHRIDEAFAVPFVLPSLQLEITASVGLAFAGAGEDVPVDLLLNADVAMYQAKRKGGGGHRIFDLREALDDNARTSAEVDLRSALARDDLGLAYQPIVGCHDGALTGVEALLRWTHPERGPVSPLAVVAIAEQSSLIDEIGAWVLERACREHARWRAGAEGAPVYLAVNVSARQLMSRGFSATVARILEETDMDPAALVLEVTEDILIEDHEGAMAVLSDLHERGIRVALDDFGTGYSSLSYLRRLPIDIVKVDRSFVADVGRDEHGRAMVTAMVHMAHALGLAVTAEGVETRAQAAEIGLLGCESAQGYLYGRPTTTDGILDRLRAMPVSP